MEHSQNASLGDAVGGHDAGDGEALESSSGILHHVHPQSSSESTSAG